MMSCFATGLPWLTLVSVSSAGRVRGGASPHPLQARQPFAGRDLTIAYMTPLSHNLTRFSAPLRLRHFDAAPLLPLAHQIPGPAAALLARGDLNSFADPTPTCMLSSHLCSTLLLAMMFHPPLAHTSAAPSAMPEADHGQLEVSAGSLLPIKPHSCRPPFILVSAWVNDEGRAMSTPPPQDRFPCRLSLLGLKNRGG